MIDTVCFSEHLPPAVFAGGFHAQHGQAQGIKSRIVIGRNAGENEIRFGLVFRYGGALVLNAALSKQRLNMVFERKPYPSLAPVLYG